jgi:DNA-binding transcriptional LysR family regulator
MSVELQQLRHFVALAEARHFGRAAITVALSQPALSRSIHNLETRLRSQLFERSRSGVRLTPVGEKFLPRAKTLLAELARALNEVDTLAGRIVGSATFGITPSFDQFIVPDVVASLLQRSAEIHLAIRSGFYEDLLVMVRTGEIDFALALLPEVHGHPEVLEEIVRDARIDVYCRPSHPLAGRSSLTLADIAGQAWVVPDQPALRLFERWFESSSAIRPRYVIRAGSIALLRATMQRADLLSLLPDHLVDHELSAGQLVRLSVATLPKTLRVALVTRRRGGVSEVSAQIMEAIRIAARSDTPQQRRKTRGS